MDFCNICANNVSNFELKNCPNCKELACLKCIKKYILDTNSTDKKCMYCGFIFSRYVLTNILNKSFINGNIFKNHIKELLFKEEKTLIPYSLSFIERRNNIKNLKNIIKNLNNKIKNDDLIFNSKKYSDLKNELYSRNLELSYLLNNNNYNKYIYKYPCANNNCNGFVNSFWICQLCENITCNHCFNIKNINHLCIKDDIETANIIKNNSKPCPNCNISIIKSDGCDQMWCVNCHTTFDWKTLQIKKGGVIHNPEYFRYMRDNGILIQRNINDNPCANNYDNAFQILLEINNKYIKINENYLNYSTIDVLYYKDVKILFDLFQNINHIEHSYLPNLIRKYDYNNYLNWKNEERIKYLEKNITEKTYKINLAKKYKERQFLNDFICIYQTLLDSSKITFINICNNLENNIEISIKNNTKVTYIIDELKSLKNFLHLIHKESIQINNLYNLYRVTFILPDALFMI